MDIKVGDTLYSVDDFTPFKVSKVESDKLWATHPNGKEYSFSKSKLEGFYYNLLNEVDYRRAKNLRTISLANFEGKFKKLTNEQLFAIVAFLENIN